MSVEKVTVWKVEFFSFSCTDTATYIYEGKFLLHLEGTALSNAALGAQHIPLKLRYQACSSEVCLPPTTLDVDAPVTVASAATPARPAHPELFQSQR